MSHFRLSDNTLTGKMKYQVIDVELAIVGYLQNRVNLCNRSLREFDARFAGFWVSIISAMQQINLPRLQRVATAIDSM